MIQVISLNQQHTFYVNYDRIETVESTPDTLITLESGRKFLVSNPVDDIVKEIEDGKRRVHNFISDK